MNARLLELARQGRRVVRLKGGDPAVFARTAEELEVLAAAGIPFEVVPGITAALAAASYVGIPITHRKHASAVAFVTGQQRDARPKPIDWRLGSLPGNAGVLHGGHQCVLNGPANCWPP
ncbi:MAG: SAM-dependent methyltransferase [Pirellulaceae bacterium]